MEVKLAKDMSSGHHNLLQCNHRKPYLVVLYLEIDVGDFSTYKPKRERRHLEQAFPNQSAPSGIGASRTRKEKSPDTLEENRKYQPSRTLYIWSDVPLKCRVIANA